jgi:hypothetical protein
MLQSDTRAFARPRHLFDFDALLAHGFATVAAHAFALAQALDRRARRRAAHWADEATRPRDRLGPRRFQHGDHGVTDAWRIR